MLMSRALEQNGNAEGDLQNNGWMATLIEHVVHIEQQVRIAKAHQI